MNKMINKMDEKQYEYVVIISKNFEKIKNIAIKYSWKEYKYPLNNCVCIVFNVNKEAHSKTNGYGCFWKLGNIPRKDPVLLFLDDNNWREIEYILDIARKRIIEFL
jgi:hypothetical protein